MCVFLVFPALEISLFSTMLFLFHNHLRDLSLLAALVISLVRKAHFYQNDSFCGTAPLWPAQSKTSLGLNKLVPIFASYKNRPCWRCLEDVVIIAQRSRPVSVNDAPNLAKKEWLGLLLIISHLCSAWVSPSDIICSRANTHSVSLSLSLSVLLTLSLSLSLSHSSPSPALKRHDFRPAQE